jgi:large subunit ribosomal protein L16
MLQPKRTKFRKMQKGRVKGMATRGHTIAFGQFGLKRLKEDGSQPVSLKQPVSQ